MPVPAVVRKSSYYNKALSQKNPGMRHYECLFYEMALAAGGCRVSRSAVAKRPTASVAGA